jgi:hypothetical protein
MTLESRKLSSMYKAVLCTQASVLLDVLKTVLVLPLSRTSAFFKNPLHLGILLTKPYFLPFDKKYSVSN